jgi:hypothetical protein
MHWLMGREEQSRPNVAVSGREASHASRGRMNCGVRRRSTSACPTSMETAAGEKEVLQVAHSMTSSARSSKDGGIVNPRAFAVFMLITISNVVGCSTGKSADLAPLKILSM